LPPGFTHCNSAVPPNDERLPPPNDDRKTFDTTLASPAALKLEVRLKLGFFVIVGVPIKCGLAANTREVLASIAKARSAIISVETMII